MTEKTAIDLMVGLKQKFSRERSKNKTYSAEELYFLVSSSLNKIKNNEMVEFETSESWDEINEQIERSRIKRYPWKKILGESLTQIILTYKKYGRTQEETIKEISENWLLENYLKEVSESDKQKILENIKISVHARYGENETAKKVMEGTK